MSLDIFFTKKKSDVIGHFKEVDFLVRYFEDLGFESGNQSSFEVSKEDIEVLLSRCKQVIKNHDLAKELLPITEEIPFENYGYEENYFKDVEGVADYLEGCLLPKLEELRDGELICFEILQ